MWQDNNNIQRKEDHNVTVKESLLRQLSQTIQEVQLHHSKSGEVCSTQEGTTSLIVVLEAIFLHALKRSLFSSAFTTLSGRDDIKPSPSFYNAVLSVSHKSVVSRIAKLNRLTTDAGRSRAWIRLALNENAMSSYLTSLGVERRITRFYATSAFMRDRDMLDTAAQLMEGLLLIPFDIPLNSSLLNTWGSEPLILSGLWSPVLKPSVQMAIDVAGSIEDDDACSEWTGSSSIRSLLTLDESQAIQIILNAPMGGQQNQLPEDIQEEVTKKMEELEDERNDILQRSYSYLVASCTPQSESESITTSEPSPMVGTEEKVLPTDELLSDSSEQPIVETTLNPEPSALKINDDYAKLFCETDKSDSLQNLCYNSLTLNDENKPKEKISLQDLVMHIPHEVGLREQCFQCTDCQLSIGLNYGPAILCNFTGNYLCENCHKSELSLIPSRIIFNWDFNKYPVGQKAASYIASVLTNPIFNINYLNNKIYNAVPEIKEILHFRKQLNLLYLYLSTCKEPTELTIRDYIYADPHIYSLNDLISVSNGTLKTEICKSLVQGKNHVVNCWFCKQRGFICEVCKNSQVIYPFDEGSTYRCNKCKAVYHGECLAEGKNCPKCKRRNNRTQDES